ncbi:translocation/assembly module TamB domain-containing protein [Qipengyuania sp.]|uniref:translocation/assembly module TamB domain-containing protein n=1 Tax=Qipengyuania sp. TaxID=2004515 RepID=UPI0035C8647E
MAGETPPDDLPDEETTDQVTADRVGNRRRIAKWTVGALGALLLLVAGAALLLNTPIGQRFLSDRIAAQTLPNGLNIRIGRIDGNLYGKAVLHDVVLSDTKGVFATIPRAVVDWNPRGWLANRLDIAHFAAQRGRLLRLPEFRSGDPDSPALPGFDISIDSLVIDDLTLAAGIAGPDPQRVNLRAEVQVTDRRLMLDSQGRLGPGDRYAIHLDAEPDGDNFDLALDYRGAAGGPVAAMLGSDSAWRARIAGDGTWSQWKGHVVVRRDEGRFAAFTLTNRAGMFHLLGQVRPQSLLTGTLARLAGDVVSIDARAAIDNRRFDGRYRLASRVLFIDAEGVIDLAENGVEGMDVTALSRAPLALGNLRLQNARLTGMIEGGFADLTIKHSLRAGRVDLGRIRITGLNQEGTATVQGGKWSIPVDAALARVDSGNALIDPRLVGGRVDGVVTIDGRRIASDRLRIVFPNTSADVAVLGDLARGTFRIDGMVEARQLALRNIGRANGNARIDLTIGGPSPWALTGALSARIAPISNATLANLAGPSLRLQGALALGANRPVAFNRMRIEGAKLSATLTGRVEGGRTTLAGTGSQADYGPFTIEATIAADGPRATLVFANPLPAAGLADVRIALAPSEEGFDIETSGQSLLGPFDGALGLIMPAGEPARIDIRRLTFSDTTATGALTLNDGALSGNLDLSGGGLDGTIALAPRDGGQALDVALRARDANFGGETPIGIRRATIRAQGVLADGRSNFTGNVRGAGLSYGSLFLGRFAAQGQITDGVGHVDASIAGRRSSTFALDLNGDVAPQRIALAARGELGGRKITMPRRAVLTELEDGGWRLAPTQVSYGDGDLLANGRFGGNALQLTLKLDRMPLSLLDLVMSDIGVGGTASGIVNYAQEGGAPPQADVRVKVDDLTRSGLVLTSMPVDLALVAELSADALSARAIFRNQDIQRGRLQMRVTDLPAGEDIAARIRAGRLNAQLRYQGAAESLWRLVAVEAFDMTGPVSIAADATGSLADPQVRGSVTSNGLRVRSSLSGTDIRNVRLRGTFAGSRLALTSFSGTADNGGAVTGSGIVDLAGLGERVQGRFLQVRGPTLDVRVAARNAHLLDANGLSATVTGPLRIVSDGLGGTIAGRVRVNQASWRLGTTSDARRLPRIATREINTPSDIGPANTTRGTWRYLINAQADSRIDVRGLGLDSEWGADIILRGTTEDPRIGGEAQVVRGTYSFAGTRFELTRGIISFDETAPIDPRLDIVADTQANGTEVEVRVTGNAMEPEVTFSSTPALPEEEILARLLFGGSITSLSATDALQLGAAVASLRGGGGLDPINQLRSAIGLDRLRIVPADPTINRETGVALGKNIGRRFYAELITDGRGYSATELEFRVTSWLSLLASVSTVGRQSALVEVSRDY